MGTTEHRESTDGIGGVWRRLLARSRPHFWLYLVGPVAIGAAYGASAQTELLSPLILGLFAYFLIPANAYLYGINDVFDAQIDRNNPKKDEREIRYRGWDPTPWAVLFTAIGGLAVAVAMPPVATPYVIGFLLLGAIYSAPPFRLKTRPPLDSLSNGLYVLPGAAAYATLSGLHPPPLVMIGAWLWTMAMHTFSAVPDIAPDQREGVKTTATVLGTRGALIYCGVCWLLASAIFGVVDWRGGALLFVYPLLVVAWVLSDIPIERAYWWYPAINAVFGAALTIGGLWRLEGV
jgi:4-hydroxybenzoate polyprenyltransferase